MANKHHLTLVVPPSLAWAVKRAACDAEQTQTAYIIEVLSKAVGYSEDTVATSKRGKLKASTVGRLAKDQAETAPIDAPKTAIDPTAAKVASVANIPGVLRASELPMLSKLSPAAAAPEPAPRPKRNCPRCERPMIAWGTGHRCDHCDQNF